MEKTEAVIRRFFTALPAIGYDLGVLADTGMYRLESVAAPRILRMLPYLEFRNTSGAHIYIRPTGESLYTLLDDLNPASLDLLAAEGYEPAAVVETSPGNFQAWLKHLQPFAKELGTLAAKMLAEQFGADRSAADWRRFGRAPGFTNRKLQHRDVDGVHPFARLHSHDGRTFTAADVFYGRLLTFKRQVEHEQTELRRRFEGRSTNINISLSRFRALPRYAARPAAADMAFSIAACAQGWTESQIAEALRCNYLSRDPDIGRQSAYISRTIGKARLWAS